MSERNEVSSEQQRRLQRRGRVQGAAIMAIILLPLLAAHLIYHTGFGIPASTVNNGDLIDPPLPVEELMLYRPGAGPWRLEDEAARWRILIPGMAECDAVCEQNLYLSRQVRTRLADNSERVARHYLLLDDRLGADTAAWLAAEHPDVRILSARPAELAATGYDGMPGGDGRYFLMDPRGFVMMAYSPEHSGGELLDDLKRMLKFSQER